MYSEDLEYGAQLIWTIGYCLNYLKEQKKREKSILDILLNLHSDIVFHNEGKKKNVHKFAVFWIVFQAHIKDQMIARCHLNLTKY